MRYRSSPWPARRALFLGRDRKSLRRGAASPSHDPPVKANVATFQPPVRECRERATAADRDVLDLVLTPFPQDSCSTYIRTCPPSSSRIQNPPESEIPKYPPKSRNDHQEKDVQTHKNVRPRCTASITTMAKTVLSPLHVVAGDASVPPPCLDFVLGSRSQSARYKHRAASRRGLRTSDNREVLWALQPMTRQPVRIDDEAAAAANVLVVRAFEYVQHPPAAVNCCCHCRSHQRVGTTVGIAPCISSRRATSGLPCAAAMVSGELKGSEVHSHIPIAKRR